MKEWISLSTLIRNSHKSHTERWINEGKETKTPKELMLEDNFFQFIQNTNG